MLTHSGMEKDVYFAVKSGAKGYLLKDTSIAQLVETISLVAKGEVVLSSAVAGKVLDEFTEYYPQWQRTRKGRGLLAGSSKSVGRRSITS